ncbi:MAG: flagellar biosynthesis protein FlhF [Calditrichaeota bacterium]|nr:MAG: flagellar biosynthesis protein FlhF [Calditrichota bacterium]
MAVKTYSGNSSVDSHHASFRLPETESSRIQAHQIESLQREVNTLKEVVQRILVLLRNSRLPSFPQAFTRAYEQLLDREVQEELARKLLRSVFQQLEASQHNNFEAVSEKLLAVLRRAIRVALPLETVKRRPYVVALVGPTGVGKTTTIAKLATFLKMHHRRRVALITADTYRIGAVEQLQTFATIAGMPFTVVHTPEDVHRALLKYGEEDFVFVDTVGRSQRDQAHLEALRQIVQACRPEETHLVLNLAAGARTLLEVARRFQVVQPNRYTFTKADECTGPGVLLNVLAYHPLPVAYITTGQVVPQDITPANPDTVANFVYTGVLKKTTSTPEKR